VAFSVFFDTCALFSASLADYLLNLAERGMFRPQWSAGVLDELRHALARRGIPEDAIERRIESMNSAFPDAEVTGYKALVSKMECDEKDRHVLATAVRGGAAALVTFNLRDFPEESLRPYDVSVVSPDEFLLDQLGLWPSLTIQTLAETVSAYEKPPLTVPEFCDQLARAGVPVFAQAIAARV
jgi:predicted nucleic acid-binding protein